MDSKVTFKLTEQESIIALDRISKGLPILTMKLKDQNGNIIRCYDYPSKNVSLKCSDGTIINLDPDKLIYKN